MPRGKEQESIPKGFPCSWPRDDAPRPLLGMGPSVRAGKHCRSPAPFVLPHPFLPGAPCEGPLRCSPGPDPWCQEDSVIYQPGPRYPR